MTAEPVLATPERITSAAPSKWRMLWLLVLPSIFLMLYGAFVQARGPFYLGSNLDPDYAYLCNSLNIARGRAPRHVDHPGTTLQTLGGMVIRATQPFNRSAERTEAVLRHPEEYLQRINFVLVGIYTASLITVGVAIRRRSGTWYPALLLQAAPFLLGDQFRVVSRVSAEPMLLIVGLLMAGLLFLETREERVRPWTICGLGFLAAAGVITKLNFLPLALTPLACLRTWKNRGAYVMCVGAFTLMWVLRLGRSRSRLLEWAHGLAFRQGRYGHGEEGIVPPEYSGNLVELVMHNPWLCLLVALSCASVVYGCIRWRRKTPQAKRWVLLLAGLAVAQSLEMAMVAKYAEWRYLLPALMFCPLNLLALVEFWRSELAPLRPLLLGATGTCVLAATAGLRTAYTDLSARGAERMEIVRALETKYGQEPRAFYYGASSPYHALWFGNYWAGELYTKQLTNIFNSEPPSYLIQEGAGALRFRVEEPLSLRDLVRYHPSFLLVGSAAQASRIFAFLPPNAQTEKLLEVSGERITRVTLK